MFAKLRDLSGNTENTQEEPYYDVKQFLNHPNKVSVTSKVQRTQLLPTTSPLNNKTFVLDKLHDDNHCPLFTIFPF